MAKHKRDCFDLVIDISAWILGFFDGCIVGCVNCCCFEPERDKEFVHEFEHGFMKGTKVTSYI